MVSCVRHLSGLGEFKCKLCAMHPITELKWLRIKEICYTVFHALRPFLHSNSDVGGINALFPEVVDYTRQHSQTQSGLLA